MESKLKAWAKSLAESGWLLALIVVPLFFNIYSSRVFEPDKISMFRSVALFVAAAMGLVLVEGLGRRSGNGSDGGVPWWKAAWKQPLVPAATAWAFSYLLSTVFSVSPRISIIGSYQRLQGTYSFFSYLVIFAAILLFLKRKDQLERLAWVMVVTSLPISLYGILQHHRLDSLPWGGDVVNRVTGNAGNAIFLSAYLIMPFFITLAMLVRSLGRMLSEEKSGMGESWKAGSLMFILFVQSVAIVYTKSRGPWLGWFGGLYLFGLLGLISIKQRSGSLDAGWMKKFASNLWLAWLGLSVAGMAFLIVLNLPNSPLEPVKEHPYIGRLGKVFETSYGTGEVRVLIWKGALQMVQPHPPIRYPDGRPDRWNFIRPIVGYGPESMWMAYSPFYQPKLAEVENRRSSPDRSHNETFDSLVTTGLIGFLAEMFFFASMFYFVLKWLGLMYAPRHVYAFGAFLVAGGALGLAIPVAVGHPEFLGVGIPVGFIVAFIFYSTWATISQQIHVGASGEKQLFLIAILSAVVAHFIEIQFGIAIGATREYFWALAAMLVVVGTRWESFGPAKAREPEPLPMERSRRKKRRKKHTRAPNLSATVKFPWWVPVTTYSLLSSFVLVTLLYDFTSNSRRVQSALRVLYNSFTTKLAGGKPVFGLGVFWMFVFTWAILGVFSVVDGRKESEGRGKSLSYLLIYLLLTLSLSLVFGIIHAARLTALTSFRPTTLESLNTLAGVVVTHTVNDYFAALLIALFCISAILWWRVKDSIPVWSSVGFVSPVVGAVLILLAFFLSVKTNLALVQADEIYKVAQSYENAHHPLEASRLYELAIDRSGKIVDMYYLFLGRSRIEQAKAAKTEGDRERFLREAEEALLRARALNPLNTDHTANLARLYNTRAQLEKDPAKRKAYLERALQYYKEAVMLSPHTSYLFNEMAAVYISMGDYRDAIATLQHSAEVEPGFDQTYLILGEVYVREKKWDKAVEAYRKAAEVKPSADAYTALGYAYSKLGKIDESIEANEKALKYSPHNVAILRNLAILYKVKKEYGKALSYAEEALKYAPDKDKAQIEKLIAEIKALKNR